MITWGLKRAPPQEFSISAKKNKKIRYLIYIIEAYSNGNLKFAYIYSISTDSTRVIPFNNGVVESFGKITEIDSLSKYFKTASSKDFPKGDLKSIVEETTNSLYRKSRDNGLKYQFNPDFADDFKIYSLV